VGDRFTEKLGMLAGKLADDEERGTRFMAVQEIEESWSDHRIRAVVKGNGEFARRICMSNCGSENFRIGIAAGVGGQAGGGGQGGGDYGEVGVHADIFA